MSSEFGKRKWANYKHKKNEMSWPERIKKLQQLRCKTRIDSIWIIWGCDSKIRLRRQSLRINPTENKRWRDWNNVNKNSIDSLKSNRLSRDKRPVKWKGRYARLTISSDSSTSSLKRKIRRTASASWRLRNCAGSSSITSYNLLLPQSTNFLNKMSRKASTLTRRSHLF